MTDTKRLEDLARHLLPPGFGVAVLALDGEPAPLLAEEAAAVSRAVEKRRREFAHGRAALRQAIRRAGHTLSANRPIAMRADRQPDLPDGMRASLSHGGDYCIAIASPPGGSWVGVDVEAMDRNPPAGLQDAVAPFRGDSEDPLLIFCIKEAMFKAQFPRTGRMLGFGDVPAVIRGDRARACLGDGLIRARWGSACRHYLAISLWRG